MTLVAKVVALRLKEGVSSFLILFVCFPSTFCFYCEWLGYILTSSLDLTKAYRFILNLSSSS